MKHNPRVHERAASLPGFRDLHPHADDEERRERSSSCGTCRRCSPRSRPPCGDAAAGSGLPGRAHRPDAHAWPTSPTAARSATRSSPRTPRTARTRQASRLAGYALAKVETGRTRQPRPRRPARQGQRANRGLMLTNPSTLGLFDEGIEEVAADFPRRRSAPLLRRRQPQRRRRRSRPGDMGFDIVHYNLHKTFSQPHGGGGPGGGPVAVRDTIEPYLPSPPSSATGRLSSRPRSAEVHRSCPRLRRARSACSFARTPSCAHTGRISARCPTSQC
jgi:glycine dehydrogenase subunit 2